MSDCGTDLPPGFEAAEKGRFQLVVRREMRSEVGAILRQWRSGRSPRGRRLAGGRGGVVAVDVNPDLSVVLRPCRRGGLVSLVNRSLYFGWRPRPLRELEIAETLRNRGVPTTEVLGVAVDWLFPGCYRGAVASREIRGARNLWQELCALSETEREEVCHRVAAVTRELHDAGGIHPDLNLQNYLVLREEGKLRVLVIDCDRVCLRPASASDRRAAFDRICASARRLDPGETVVTPACTAALRAIAAA